MLGSSPPVDVLEPEGWAHDRNGEIAEGKPQSKGNYAPFKHSQELQAQDVLRTRVEGRGAFVGFATESYDVEKHEETMASIAVVALYDGSTVIRSGISLDGEEHLHQRHVKDYIPKTLPYDVALRINKDGNVPQIQFNDDGVWHDFAPDRVGLDAGPWFRYLELYDDARLSDHCVHRPKPTN